MHLDISPCQQSKVTVDGVGVCGSVFVWLWCVWYTFVLLNSSKTVVHVTGDTHMLTHIHNIQNVDTPANGREEKTSDGAEEGRSSLRPQGM